MHKLPVLFGGGDTPAKEVEIIITDKMEQELKELQDKIDPEHKLDNVR